MAAGTFENGELDQACRQVGRFMYHFAAVEKSLDRIIQKAWELDDTQILLLASSLNIHQKKKIAQSAIDEQDTSERWRESARSELKKLQKLSDERNMFAHSLFHMVGKDSIEFDYFSAKGDREAGKRVVRRLEEMENKFRIMNDLVLALNRIRRSMRSLLASREYVYTFEHHTGYPHEWLSEISEESGKHAGSVVKFVPGDTEDDITSVTVAFPSAQLLGEYVRQYWKGVCDDDFIDEQLDAIKTRSKDDI
ncbi:hypothetical protein [Methylobacterium oryzisoli]|uniref:hypothetical protein n=1 Tax=Methylobacterium oryzisoli TaxID=3385502 RepID=UPI0038928A18